MRLFTWDGDGNRIHYDCSFDPYLYTETLDDGDAKSIFNTNLKKRTFRNQFDRKRFLLDSGITRVFDNLPPIQQFLIDTYYDKNDTPEFSQFPLKIYFLDIETYSPGEFPIPSIAKDTINVITVHDSITKKFTTWGLKPYTSTQPDVTYILCASETELLNRFINFIQQDPPDILSGYNCEFFDFPYIINRIKKLIGDDACNRLSPAGRVYSRQVFGKFGKELEKWHIEGISCIDYLDIYRKFCPKLRDSYKLGAIGETELGETKVEYGEQNLSSLADSNWPLFIDYNIQDVRLLVKLEIKLKYLELLRMLAYAGCGTFEAALGSLSIITGLCAIRARAKKVRIPTFDRGEDDGSKNEGAYVGQPQQGFQDHIVSFDANSLYPNVMITLNLSPETKVGKVIEQTPEKVVVHHVNGQQFELTPEKFKKFKQIEQLTQSKAGILCSQKQKGIVPEIVDSFYQKRVEVKKQLKKIEKQLAGIDKELAKLRAMQ